MGSILNLEVSLLNRHNKYSNYYKDSNYYIDITNKVSFATVKLEYFGLNSHTYQILILLVSCFQLFNRKYKQFVPINDQ